MDTAESVFPVLARVPTGVEGLDAILHGGFLHGGMYVVVGPPGAGKTILANQISTHHARTGGTVVYITMFAETHARMFQHLRTLTFFDPTLIGTAIRYFSGVRFLQDAGLAGVMDFLRRELRTLQPRLLVLDGFAVIHQHAMSPMALRSFFQDLQVFSEANDCTALILAHAETGEPPPEFTMVDGVMYLRSRADGARAIRELEVVKLRGSDYLSGRHTFQITAAGVVVFPRLETLLRHPSQVPGATSLRTSIGLAALDAMLHGGVFQATTTMVQGPSGAGKTLLSLHFLAEGLRAGAAVGYLGFAETSPQLLVKAERIGLPFQEAWASGHLQVIWIPPTEGSIDAVAARILTMVRDHAITRLVIDGLGALERFATDLSRLPRFYTALRNELHAQGVTTMLTVEGPARWAPAAHPPFGVVSSLMDHLLVLDTVLVGAQRQRVVSIIKMRDSGYDPTIRQVIIDDRGLHLGDAVDLAPLGGSDALGT